MKTGFQAVQAVIEKSKSQNQGGSFLPYILWKDDRNGEGKEYEKVVRFLTDEVVPCKLYEFIPCKDQKLRDFIVPESVGIESPDIVKESGVKVPSYNNRAVLVDPKPRDLTLGIVVLREEKSEMVNGRRVLTYRDKMEEVTYEKDGETITEKRPIYGIVKQSNVNFWGTVAGYWSRYGTITDRDYVVTRTNNDKDTLYTIVPCDPVEGLRTEEELKKAYQPPTTLTKLVENLADPERARKLLQGEGSTPDKESTQSSGDTTTGTQFASLRNELLDQS